MSRLPAAPADPLRALRRELDDLPPVLEALANAPRAARGVASLMEACLLDGVIPRTTKELIALAAVSLAGVSALRDQLAASLGARGVDRALLEQLQTEGESPRLPERTQELLFLGRRAALQPALLTDADFARARRQGVNDAELAEVIALAGLVALLVTTSRALDCG